MKDGPIRPAWEWPTTFLNWLEQARMELDHLPFTHTYPHWPGTDGHPVATFGLALERVWSLIQYAIDQSNGWTIGINSYSSPGEPYLPTDGYVVSIPGSAVQADTFQDWINWINATTLLRDSRKVWFGGWSPEPGVIHHELSIVFNHLPLAKVYAEQWAQREIWALHSNKAIEMGGDGAPYVDPFGTHGANLLAEAISSLYPFGTESQRIVAEALASL